MGDLTFLSTSRERFYSIVCPESVVLSMLFDKNLTVPDSASAVQLEERARATVPNPFNTMSLRAKSKDKKNPDGKNSCGSPRCKLESEFHPFRYLSSMLRCLKSPDDLALQDAAPEEEPPPPPPPPLTAQEPPVQDDVELSSTRAHGSCRKVALLHMFMQHPLILTHAPRDSQSKTLSASENWECSPYPTRVSKTPSSVTNMRRV
jgi:hypothetical protein